MKVYFFLYLGIIEDTILPGSVIHSDGWRAYQGIPAIPVIPPYTHHVVNHQVNFVDPLTGATTNHIERWWKECKQKLKRMNGVPRESLPSYLDEFMWRQIRGKKGNEAFDRLLEDISNWYIV